MLKDRERYFGVGYVQRKEAYRKISKIDEDGQKNKGLGKDFYKLGDF